MTIGTITNIHATLVEVVEDLDPRGEIAAGNGDFRHSEFAMPVLDREFVMGEFESPESTFFGAIDEQDYMAEFDLIVAHTIGNDQPIDQQRISDDVSAIQQKFEATSTFEPIDGVSLIRLTGTTKQEFEVGEGEDTETIMHTTLRFKINYTLASVV